MTLPFQEVFTPAPSGVGPNPPPSGSWLAQLLTNATTLQLATTAWYSGGMGRTIIAIVANMLMLQDVNTSIMGQGGFLDYAASGSVTYVDPNDSTGQTTITQYVTPDPNNPATWPTPGVVPGPGWLDILAQGSGLTRIPATFASGTMALTSTNSGSLGPFAPGTYHVANNDGSTYSNVNTLTIAPGPNTAPFRADVSGSGSTTPIGSITTAVTSLVGVTVTNTTQFTGTPPESNVKLAARVRLLLQALSTGGTEGAYVFWALTSSQVLAALSPPVTLSIGTVTSATTVLNPATGNVQTVVSGDGTGVSPGDPTVPGVTNVAITDATNASPIVLTVPSTFDMISGMGGLVSGVDGNTAANGYWSNIVVVDSTHISLTGSVGNGTYTSGGVLEAGDLGLVDSVIQENAVPLAVTAQTVSATAQGVIVAVSVSVPASQGTAVIAALQTAIDDYVASVPVGGYTAGVGAPNTMPIEGVVGACFIAAPYIRDVAMTLNGLPLDLVVGTSNKLVLAGTPTVSVTVF